MFNQTTIFERDSYVIAEDGKISELVEGVIERLNSSGYNGNVLLIGNVGRYIMIFHEDGEDEIATNEKLKRLRPVIELVLGRKNMRSYRDND